MHVIELWLEQYGYLTLFIGLLLEYIALPFPGELVMGYSGYLVFQGKLHLLPALLVSWGGTSIGMAVNYAIGRKLGYPFLSKFGPKFFLVANRGDPRLMNAVDRRKWLMVLIGGLFSMAGIYMFSTQER